MRERHNELFSLKKALFTYFDAFLEQSPRQSAPAERYCEKMGNFKAKVGMKARHGHHSCGRLVEYGALKLLQLSKVPLLVTVQ